MIKFCLILTLALSATVASAAAPQTLSEKMEALNLDDRAPSMVSTEKLYSVQTRLSPLTKRSEITLGGASNLTGDSFLTSRMLELAYRYHFTDRWAAGISHGFVSNNLSDAATRLQDTSGLLPSVPYATSRTDLTAEANLFYGKFRLTSDRVFYFDQYVALGGGIVQMNNGSQPAIVADAGLALWFGQAFSLRAGLKDFYHQEVYPSGTVAEHNLHAHLNVGYLF